MVAVEGLEEQHFVARVEQRHGGGMQAGGGARGHQHLGFRIVAEAVVALLLGGDRRAQAGNAIKPRVDVVSGPDSRDGFCLDLRGNRGIAHPLRQVDAAQALALRGHGADLRLHGTGSQLAELKAGALGCCDGGGGDGRGKFGHGEDSFANHLTIRSASMRREHADRRQAA